MFKLTDTWNDTTELSARKVMGEKLVSQLLTMDESKFSNQMIGLLGLLTISNTESKILELAVEDGNRVRIYHIILTILMRSFSVIKEVGGEGIDQEDIEQHGLYDESDHFTLVNERSIEGICHICPILNDMDFQDLIHTYTNN